jgi:hypothetical protein
MEDQMRKHGIFALMLAVGCYAPLSAHAAVTCSNTTLNGTYTATITGTYATVANGALSNQYSAVGQIVTDGAGGLTGTMTLNLNGQVIKGVAFTGTYTAASSCSGTVKLNFTGGGGLPFDIFISSGGFSGIDSDGNTNIVINVTQ